MPSPRDVLTPDSLAMLQAIADTGSFAAAARQIGVVPSALTYRVRQMEEALDVLLFDRRARHAQPTEAGQALLTEGIRLLQDLDAVAHRVRRVAIGWEPEFTVVVDGALNPSTVLDLIEGFYAIAPPTKLKLGQEILSGTLAALAHGKADLVIGVSTMPSGISGLQVQDLGELEFSFAVAPCHPLAQATEPLSDAELQQHRLVVVADSSPTESVSLGLLQGQDTLTVSSMQAKIEAQIRGLGCGFLPHALLQPHVQSGDLLVKAVQRPTRKAMMRYGWRTPSAGHTGRALQWWLEQLASPVTRSALLGQPSPHA